MIRHAESELIVQKRDGRVVPFDRARIESAVGGAFKAELGMKDAQNLDSDLLEEVRMVCDIVVDEVSQNGISKEGASVESIQDAVEMNLMKRGHYRVARRYIVYREEHKKIRKIRGEDDVQTDEQVYYVKYEDGSRKPFDSARVKQRLFQACRGLEEICDVQEMLDEIYASLFDGITPNEIDKVLILSARSRIERDPAFGKVAARLLLRQIYREAIDGALAPENFDVTYRQQFVRYIKDGVATNRLDKKLLDYDLEKLSKALSPSNDGLFQFLGLQTIYDRYLLNDHGRRIETPQFFWMRVAMGLAIAEGERKIERAQQFYSVLSTFRFTSATPTLFNSATLHPQLSSCYLSTTDDSLDHIFKVVGDNAKLSKWAGGLGNDWTQVRATGSYINGTHGSSQGVIPFLKVVNDTAVAVNQGGKRKGAVCAYLESWHLDIEEFLDLRKNTGDDRRRTHDMHTANWIPDLFMKRVEEKADWTLFSPDEVPDLHDLYGAAFEKRYHEYEKMAEDGKINLTRKVSAVELWRKMLSRIFETGHPWITFKDPSNIRSPQDHKGVVHSSNLCTEILLNTSNEETAVCNLGSINLGAHTTKTGLDIKKLEETVKIAVRMLDNVIDINYYPTDEARASNQRHRPVGLGLMGFQDALYIQGVSYASQDAIEFADRSMEAISFFALQASSDLAKERGTYESYEGSKWDRGILPIDTIEIHEKERGVPVEVDRSSVMDWDKVRESIKKHGMRNSNVMAIAPTATISTIVGVSASIEPTYKNLFVKSNLSGDFTQINAHMVKDLKALGLWDQQMIDDIKYYDGSLTEIDRVPDDIKHRYLTVFEIDAKWLIECGARRQKWIDMGQSLNLYITEATGRKLHDMYFHAWKTGLKTTYYLRSLGATQIEKSTLDVNKYGAQPRWMKNKSSSSTIIQRANNRIKEDSDEIAPPPPVDDQIPPSVEDDDRVMTPGAAVCNMDEGCEACQ